jgi:hypothetical protein
MRERLAILDEQDRLRLSNAEICRRQNIQPTQLRRWRQSIAQLRSAGTQRTLLHVGRRPDFVEFESDLLWYVLDRRSSRTIVTVHNLTDTLLRMVPHVRHKSFNKMRRWIYRFIDRNRLSI